MLKSYIELYDYAIELWQQEKVKEIIEVYNKYINVFLEDNYEMTWVLAQCYSSVGQLEKAYNLLEEGIVKGYFYPIFPDDSIFNKPSYENRFKDLLERIDELKIKKQESSIAKYILESPRTYSKETPLFISLHGWGESMEFFKAKWESKTIEDQFHHLFIQSSQVCTYNGYCWNSTEKAFEDICIIINKVKDELGFLPERMFVGGFSQGGEIAIEICLKTDFPIKGVVILCPGLREEYLKNEIDLLSSKLEYLAIITGENDMVLENQKRFIELIKKANLRHKYIIIEKLGHWFPDNLKELLDNEANNLLSTE